LTNSSSAAAANRTASRSAKFWANLARPTLSVGRAKVPSSGQKKMLLHLPTNEDSLTSSMADRPFPLGG